MTTTAIKWLVYDLIRSGTATDDISTTLRERGATLDDLVAYIVEEHEPSHTEKAR